MKLKPDAKALTRTFLAAFFIAAVVLNIVCINLFYFTAWTFVQPLVIALFLAISLAFYFLALFGFSYELERKRLVVKRLSSTMYYDYSEILYIDETKSRKKNQLIFVTSKGHVRYVIADKNGILIDRVVEKCRDTISLDALQRRFPKIRI